MGPPRYRRECLQRVWRADEDDSRKSDRSIEDPKVIGKIQSHLQATSCAPPACSATCAVGARAAAAWELPAPTRATGARLGMVHGYCTSQSRVGQSLQASAWQKKAAAVAVVRTELQTLKM